MSPLRLYFDQLYPTTYTESHKQAFPGSRHPNLQVDIPLSNRFTECQTARYQFKIITLSAKVAKRLQTVGLKFHFQSHRMHNYNGLYLKYL